VRVGVTPPVSPVLAHHLAGVIHTDAPDVDISIKRMWSHDLERVVAEHEIDVAITFGPVPTRPGVVSETICGEPLLVALRPGHRLAGRATVTLADLAGETFGLPSKELFPAWALAQRHALDVAAVSPPTVELADTDLSAHKWPTQSEVDWILTTASIAAPDMPAAMRPVGLDTSSRTRFTGRRGVTEIPRYYTLSGRPAGPTFPRGGRNSVISSAGGTSRPEHQAEPPPNNF
jgi:DNA-binding transcriptional LysR family regulator